MAGGGHDDDDGWATKMTVRTTITAAIAAEGGDAKQKN
jgi:hypothetical protein